MASPIKLKRIYEAPAAGDGTRILVDRLWPRGIAKDKAKIDLSVTTDSGPKAIEAILAFARACLVSTG